MFNKRGSEDLTYLAIFVVLNLIFFSGLLYMGYSASSGALIYEESYAKQIALLLDSSYSGMIHEFSFEKVFEISDKNEILRENTLKIGDNKVIVKLSDGNGYSYQYFTDYDISIELKENVWRIEVNEKTK